MNSYFACLVTPRLFDTISIGRTYSNADIPTDILRHTRFLSLYEYAFSNSTNIWSKIQAIELAGIRCDAYARTPFWPLLETHLLSFHSHIVHLSLRCSSLSFSASGLMKFEAAITMLAKTVKSMTIDMHANDFNALSAIKVIKCNFTELTSMEISGLDAFSCIWVFSDDWVCSPGLQVLRLSHSCICFPDELSQFIRYLPNLTRVEVEDCRPFFITFENPNNANALYIERGRTLELIDKGTFVFGNPEAKTPIQIALVEIDEFIDS
ncbi:hypothetical protein CPB86DRAFT_519697 [Serendipita vermifera]|nr:hypothetical protein CPB86DRAFT_519697 [Serendipita vermifera]